MNNVEYSIEPNGDIAHHNARAARLAAIAKARAVKLEGLTRRAAYEVKAELAGLLDFDLRVRGSL